MKGDRMFELYSEFVGKNEKEIIDDFCSKVKRETIGDLTLDEYSRFRFWEDHLSDELKSFYKVFKDETKSDVSYNTFCELMWNTLDSSLPENLQEMMDSIKTLTIGEA